MKTRIIPSMEVFFKVASSSRSLSVCSWFWYWRWRNWFWTVSSSKAAEKGKITHNYHIQSELGIDILSIPGFSSRNLLRMRMVRFCQVLSWEATLSNSALLTHCSPECDIALNTFMPCMYDRSHAHHSLCCCWTVALAAGRFTSPSTASKKSTFNSIILSHFTVDSIVYGDFYI